jgi:hypothetical protein
MLFLNPNNFVVAHRGQNDGRGPSPRLWSRMNGALMAPDGAQRGALYGSDFKMFGGILDSDISATVGLYIDENGFYRSYQDTSDTIAQIATDKNGAITFTSAATDNNSAVLQCGGSASVSSAITAAGAGNKMVIFECRGKVGQLTETGLLWALTEEGLTADDILVDDTGALPSKDLIGFHAPMAASTCVVDFVYRKAGQTAQVIIDDLATLVADTYVKLGFIYDYSEPAANRIAVFKDGVLQTTYVTETNIAASTFPSGEELQPLFAQKTGAAAAKTSTLDWWYLFTSE